MMQKDTVSAPNAGNVDGDAPTRCPICRDAADYDYSGRDLMFDRRRRHDYYLCRSCQCVFQHPMPDAQTIATFYPQTYSVYDEESRTRVISPTRIALLKRLRGYTHLRPTLPRRLWAALSAPWQKIGTPAWQGGGRLLDVGCGNGRFLTSMRSLGWDVHGVEISEDGMKACRQSDLPVHHGDLFSAAYTDASFDLVTVRHVIEHVPDPLTFVAELARVLRPGGRLVIETPNSQALGRQWFATYWYANDVPRHLFLFSPSNLERLGAGAGLVMCAMTMDTTPKIFLNSLDYTTRNQGKLSKRMRWRRFLARAYVWQAQRRNRGDTLQMTFVKPALTSPA